MSTTSALLLTLLMMATTGAAADGRFSVQLRLSSLSETPVTTTLVLQGEAHQPITVSSLNTQSNTLDFKMNSDQVLDNEPILLDVSVRTDKDFRMETVRLDRISPQVHSIGGLITIASSESKCAKNYYGPFCSWNCAPNEKMHLACTAEGERICMEGWQGPKCDQQVCPIACRNGGACDGGRCRCPVGFTGEACEQCLPAVGCVNGGCHNNKTGTCECREGWTGALCNIDLSLCFKKKCAADEICIVKAPGRPPLCIPIKHNSGDRGDLDIKKQCPCKNGGSCLSSTGRSSAPICSCPFGFGGRLCEESTVPVGTVPEAQSTIKYFIVAHAVTCSLFLICALLLFVVALRIIKSSRVCGGPAPPSNHQSKTQPLQNFIYHPSDSLPSPPSSPSKGDELFFAAKDHSKKDVVFELIDETTGDPRYTSPPSKTTVFSIPIDPSTEKEKVYEALPV